MAFEWGTLRGRIGARGLSARGRVSAVSCVGVTRPPCLAYVRGKQSLPPNNPLPVCAVIDAVEFAQGNAASLARPGIAFALGDDKA